MTPAAQPLNDGTATSSSQPQIAVSTTFYPGAILSSDLSPAEFDFIIQSNDGVFFFCHTSMVLSKSTNHFNHLAPSFLDSSLAAPDSNWTNSDNTRACSPERSDGGHSHRAKEAKPAQPVLIIIPEPSAVVNIALHCIYSIDFQVYSPELEVLSHALQFLHTYGLSSASAASSPDLIPSSAPQLHIALQAFAPNHPLEVYALAARYRMHDLAVTASRYTVALSLSVVTDQQCIDMGAVYLKRLVLLHVQREEALKQILVSPFEHHPLTSGRATTCDEEDRCALARAWALCTAYVLSTSMGLQGALAEMLRSTYGPLASSVRCGRCKYALTDRIDRVLREWSMVRCTI